MERLKKIGNISPVHASEVKKSTLGIGFEKLDRAVFEPEKAYDKVAELGVKWVRIQSGWARTEKAKGVYDFAWLDSIVDNLLQRGLTPWLCLCYGNGIYDEDAAKVFGAVGCPPIKTEEQKKAWHNYVVETVKRYTGKIEWFEVWNEPDGQWCWKHGVSGKEYGNFVIDTAKAVKEANPDAKVIGGVVCCSHPAFLTDMISTGAVNSMDGYSYHGYTSRERDSVLLPRLGKTLCRQIKPDIKFIQGETGTQSRSDGSGALKGMAWTPLKQAKFLSRIILSHLLEGVFINSYFSCIDMIEALNGTVGNKASYLDYGYFGVLGAEFDENGLATGTYTPKPSYRTLQVLASIFREDYEMKELPVRLVSGFSHRTSFMDAPYETMISQGFVKPNGSSAFVYWQPENMLTTSFESTITIQCAGMTGTPRLVDLLDGSVYEIPESIMQRENDNAITFRNIPVKDSPLLLTFGDFAETADL
ncbi:MAG: beta-galactosidase [Lentisphaeria bacterium]|nr:beta-galactosidase [Lentisphaeria bacterium]